MNSIQKIGLILLVAGAIMFFIGVAGFTGEFSGYTLNEIAKYSFFFSFPRNHQVLFY
ncbi:hypothetical protein [Mucilaginibacter hurinus]|uniref:hypothetical protein n=1 Tax=Mucilaginibacter hurinus TaxID=2201324 RepID=UPI0013142EBE|nr:hypothetical protein [Mucilaginibacter hurinus]